MINIKRTLAFTAVTLLFAGCPSEPIPFNPPSSEYPEAFLMYSNNTKRLFNYLFDSYGNVIISGQMDAAWAENSRIDMITRVYNDVGKYPAMKGFDLIDLPYSWSNYGKNEIDEAVEWWNGQNRKDEKQPAETLLPGKPDIHGIVSFCWHWRVTGWRSNDPETASMEFYTNQTNFRIPMKAGKLDTTHANFQTIKSDLDKAAALLQQLKDKDIPVLWRPLHEASGRWFWWGASGPEAYIALWEYMYDYLTNEKKLNNLIWVWNGQHRDWFPNPNTAHIVGYDYYVPSSQPAQNYSSQVSTFVRTLEMVPNKDRIVALTENGAIPDPVNCKNDNAMWSWFMTWNDSTNGTNVTSSSNFWSGEHHNTKAHKQYVYNHELVITLDELPDLTKYKLE